MAEAAAPAVARRALPAPLRRILASPATLAGLGLCALHLALALFAPLLAPHSVSAILTDGLTPPSAAHWLGTDQIGRDYLSRLMSGGRVALLVSTTGAAVAVLAGAALGIAAGYRGGWVDDVVMRVVDTLMSLPEIVLIAILVLTFGKDLAALALVVAIVYLPGAVRVARARAVSLAALDYVRAAELRGESAARIMLREIAPNLAGLMAVELAIRTSAAVLKISALSFLGLGVSQPTPDWGLMVQEAMGVVFTDPWFLILPAVALSSLVIGINFAVDGIARAFGLSAGEA